MSKADERIINLCNAHIDWGKGESQTALQRKIEMLDTEKRIKELTQYEYKRESN